MFHKVMNLAPAFQECPFQTQSYCHLFPVECSKQVFLDNFPSLFFAPVPAENMLLVSKLEHQLFSYFFSELNVLPSIFSFGIRDVKQSVDAATRMVSTVTDYPQFQKTCSSCLIVALPRLNFWKQ